MLQFHPLPEFVVEQCRCLVPVHRLLKDYPAYKRIRLACRLQPVGALQPVASVLRAQVLRPVLPVTRWDRNGPLLLGEEQRHAFHVSSELAHHAQLYLGCLHHQHSQKLRCTVLRLDWLRVPYA